MLKKMGEDLILSFNIVEDFQFLRMLVSVEFQAQMN